MDFFLQLLVNGVCIGLLYGISAMGFIMIFKASSVLNFAHGELLALGAFFFLSLVTWGKLPVAAAFVLTLAGCFLLGFIIEKFFLRPLIGEKLIFVIMLTVGLAAMFKGSFCSSGEATCTPILNSCPNGSSFNWAASILPLFIPRQ